MLGNCPHCNVGLSNLTVQPYDAGVTAGQGPSFSAAVISCPQCRVIISVVPDPNTIARDVEYRLTGKTPAP